jgi:hypothetical protein
MTVPRIAPTLAPDISVPLLGIDRVEVKCGGNRFAQIYKWSMVITPWL